VSDYLSVEYGSRLQSCWSLSIMGGEFFQGVSHLPLSLRGGIAWNPALGTRRKEHFTKWRVRSRRSPAWLTPPFTKERHFVYAFKKSIVSEKGFTSPESNVDIWRIDWWTWHAEKSAQQGNAADVLQPPLIFVLGRSTKSDIGLLGTAPIWYGMVKRSEEYLWSSAGGHMNGKKVK